MVLYGFPSGKQQVGTGCVLLPHVLEDGQTKVAAAAAHKLARLICTMLAKGQEYTDQAQDYYEERDRERVLRSLSQRAAKLGLKMVPIEQPS